MKSEDILNMQNVQGHAETKDEVIFFVNRKIKMATINRYIASPSSPWQEKDVIPKTIKTGLFQKKKTEVIEIGNIKAQADTGFYRPLKGGCEISPKGINWVGTAGCIVRINKYDSARGLKSLYLVDAYYSFLSVLKHFGLKVDTKPAFLTNAHVTQGSVLNPVFGVPITQPNNGSHIGNAIYTIPFKKGKVQEFDCSLVEITEKTVQESVIEVGVLQGQRDVIVGEKVHKYGRTTRYTQGTCKIRNATLAINYGDAGVFTFKGLDIYTRMSAGGDSGSVIVAQKDNKAVSLLFAGSNTITIGIPFVKIAKRLHIEV